MESPPIYRSRGSEEEGDLPPAQKKLQKSRQKIQTTRMGQPCFCSRRGNEIHQPPSRLPMSGTKVEQGNKRASWYRTGLLGPSGEIQLARLIVFALSWWASRKEHESKVHGASHTDMRIKQVQSTDANNDQKQRSAPSRAIFARIIRPANCWKQECKRSLRSLAFLRPGGKFRVPSCFSGENRSSAHQGNSEFRVAW